MNPGLTTIITSLFLLCTPVHEPPVWGFYGHSLINRMAVFTLPTSVIGPYKFHIDFIADHAVDPDKRRYATSHEAVRHYIDLDHWGEPPFADLPRHWTEALAVFFELKCVTQAGDTIDIYSLNDGKASKYGESNSRDFVNRHLLPVYYEEHWTFDCDTVKAYFGDVNCTDCQVIFGSEHFTERGILPYHLSAMQSRLSNAFARKDLSDVLRLSADFGHYIADAHVPLHTTENYNGQLTNQTGIHAFWESRIPELFAEDSWDFLVGQAKYIENPVEFYWNIVLESHALVDEVLSVERELSKDIPSDMQTCFEERAGVLVRTQCPGYALAYSDRMGGMVESQMRKAILAVGSAWFTAWVDGGQPVFEEYMTSLSEKDRVEFEELERAFIRGEARGRNHDN